MIRFNGELALIFGAGGMALLTPLYILRSGDPPPPHSLRLAATQLPPPTELALRGTALEAPLFNPDRAPPPPPEEIAADDGTAAAVAALPPLLVGTVGRRGSAGIALVKNSAGETLTLHAGETVDGWTLVAIGNGVATVDQNGRRETISLDFSNRSSGSQMAGVQGGETALRETQPNPAGLVMPSQLTNQSNATDSANGMAGR